MVSTHRNIRLITIGSRNALNCYLKGGGDQQFYEEKERVLSTVAPMINVGKEVRTNQPTVVDLKHGSWLTVVDLKHGSWFNVFINTSE